MPAGARDGLRSSRASWDDRRPLKRRWVRGGGVRSHAIVRFLASGSPLAMQPLNGGAADFVLSADAIKSLKPGRNVIAVHCHQTGGGQYIDVGIVSLETAPK